MVALESVKLFRDLRPEEMRALRAISREKRFAAGQVIFEEGDPGDAAYVLKDGLVEIGSGVNPSERRVFSQFQPGEVFGEMSVIEHMPRSATAIAAKDSVVYFIPSGEMLSLVERSPALALSLLKEISARLREFNQQHLREVLQAEQLAVIGRFARAIVHDLKNPLTIIGLTAEMASMPDATPDFRAQAHDRIRKQIDRISELVGEILQFTQGGHLDSTLTPMDYPQFIAQVLEELHHETGHKSVTVKLGNKPPTVTALINPKRLRRVFFNLVHNAMDVMTDGGRILLRFKRDGDELVTEVVDSGPGIPPEIEERLFQAFATHGKKHGTGLGLSICKKIVEDHGGRIWARNEPGGGAVFAFTLPLAK
ncbi:MAG TPA: ATP-binding protein [Verrucomicrobiota bacterium]|nr:ATP-binding protein [Verrucomicrobiota bacterium]